MFESRFFGVLFEGMWVENPKVSTGGFWCFSLKSSGAPNLREKSYSLWAAVLLVQDLASPVLDFGRCP